MDFKQSLISLFLLIILGLLLISCDNYTEEISKPIICFTFDDGHANAYENGLAIFQEYKFPATSFINSGRIGQNTFISWEDISNLVAQGWEIGGHTVNHVQLIELTDAEATYQIVQDYNNFKEHGIILESFALPSGHASERDYEILKSVYKNIRNSIDKEMHSPLNRLDLGYFAYQTNYTPEFVKERIIRGSLNGEILIIIGFHKISDDMTAISNCTSSDLAEILDWVYLQGYEVMTLNKAIEKIRKK